MIAYRLKKAHLNLIRHFADDACIGGISRMRSKDDREKSLLQDQIVGQIGEMCLNLYHNGTVDQYIAARKAKNKNKTAGDKGSDLPGILVDVKTSCKALGRKAIDHRLAVRPTERHSNCIYILAITDINNFKEDTSCLCVLVGWAADHELPKKPNLSGTFRGAYTIPGDELNKLPKYFDDLPFTRLDS